ncbi:hypothetical protein [Aquiflexum lacus]|uniref:hypothetical protein n=1 Tax=Aquiflexum lacus TaxID=2483805 RepID=UPI0018955608|nr:hypothetical protein [Aquiflexum lacus]
MKVTEKFFMGLSDQEMRGISGGGDSIFYKLGQAGHKVWCDIKDAWQDFKASPSPGYGGVTGVGTHGATK